MRIFAILAVSLLLFGPGVLLAIEAGESLADPKLEQRALAVGETLRCMVCAGESVNESPARLAKSMRGVIREKIKAGWSDQQIRDYLRERYGDVILFNPPLKTATWLLWAGPWVILTCSLAAYLLYLRGFKKRLQR